MEELNQQFAKKPLIELFSFSGIGLIFQCQSGVLYTNQVGGYACLQPEIEGVFMPLADEKFDKYHDLKRFFARGNWKGNCYNGINEETAKFVDSILFNLLGTQTVEVDKDKLFESNEAWIYVVAFDDGVTYKQWEGFGDATGVLTWMNSD